MCIKYYVFTVYMPRKSRKQIGSNMSIVQEPIHNVPVGDNGMFMGGDDVDSGNIFSRILKTINGSVNSLNNSKYFAGLVMILLNLGSKVVTVQFSKSTQEYLKYSLSKQVFVFGLDGHKRHIHVNCFDSRIYYSL